jgi:uncharacterized protein (TIGR02996 family)
MSAPLPDEQSALLRAIVAEPDDDAPRLVYADWLQEHDDEEQAQFIRDSIGLEWLDDYEDEKRQEIGQRLDGIAARNGAGWLEAVGVTGTDPAYDRGMVEAVHYASAELFIADAPTLFARVPVREVTIGSLSDDLERDWLSVLADMPDLARLRGLWLSNHWYPVPSDGWERFITSPHLANLRVLAVQDAALSDDDVRAFDRTEHLVNLEELGLAGNRLTAVGGLTVVRSRRLPNLRHLDLAHNDIVEDRRRGSAFLELRDALFDRFNRMTALGTVV